MRHERAQRFDKLTTGKTAPLPDGGVYQTFAKWSMLVITILKNTRQAFQPLET